MDVMMVQTNREVGEEGQAKSFRKTTGENLGKEVGPGGDSVPKLKDQESQIEEQLRAGRFEKRGKRQNHGWKLSKNKRSKAKNEIFLRRDEDHSGLDPIEQVEVIVDKVEESSCDDDKGGKIEISSDDDDKTGDLIIGNKEFDKVPELKAKKSLQLPSTDKLAKAGGSVQDQGCPKPTAGMGLQSSVFKDVTEGSIIVEGSQEDKSNLVEKVNTLPKKVADMETVDEVVEISSDDDETWDEITGTNETAKGKEQIKALEVQISDMSLELECPVCFEVCAPPIYMCLAQHPVCSGCRMDLKDCAVCREPYDQGLIRHRYAERDYEKLEEVRRRLLALQDHMVSS